MREASRVADTPSILHAFETAQHRSGQGRYKLQSAMGERQPTVSAPEPRIKLKIAQSRPGARELRSGQYTRRRGAFCASPCFDLLRLRAHARPLDIFSVGRHHAAVRGAVAAIQPIASLLLGDPGDRSAKLRYSDGGNAPRHFGMLAPER